MNIKDPENGENFFTVIFVVMLMMLKIMCPLVIFYALHHPSRVHPHGTMIVLHETKKQKKVTLG